MYGNILFFLLFLLVYSLYQPLDHPPVSWAAALGYNLVLLVLFGWSARSVAGKFARRIREGHAVSPSLIFVRMQTRLAMLALVFFGTSIYMLGLKELIVSLPWVKHSEALTGGIGLLVFCLYLALMWSAVYLIYKEVYRSSVTREQYVWSQIRFNFFVVIPWLFFSALIDLENQLPSSSFKTMLHTYWGQMVIIIFFLTLLALVFPLMIKPLWGLRPLPPGDRRSAIESFCRRHAFKYREIMLWPLNQGEALTAGVMGFIRPLRYILITPALLRILEDDELEGVMAHELGHVKYRHMLWYFFFFLGFVILAMVLTDINQVFLVFLPWTRDMMMSTGDKPSTVLSILVQAPIIILTLLFVRFVLGAYLRSFERQADLYAFQLTGSIHGIVSSLEKIAYYAGQSRNVPSWHHYSVAQRIEFLEECRQNPETGPRHNRKIRKMIAVYLAVMVLGIFGAYHYRQSDIMKRANISYLESLRQDNPDDVSLHLALGDFYAEVEKSREAVQSYERALALADGDLRLLNDARFLNNLAWSLVTQDSPSREDKSRALVLAQRASDLQNEPYILDTLAEVLFINGRRDEAVVTIDRAIKKTDPSSDLFPHLTRQRKKFLDDY